MVLRLFGLLLISQLCGCVGPLAEGEFVIHATAHPPTFDIAIFRERKTAVLPPVVGAAQQGYAPELALALSRAITDASQAIRYVPPHVTLSLLNQYNLAELYTQMIDKYRNAGVLNKDALEVMGEALNADYVLLPVFAGFFQQTDDRLSQMITLVRTYSTQVHLALQLWNTRTGELVWQSSGQATLAKERISAMPVVLADVSHGLWLGMLEDLLAGRTSSRYAPTEELVGFH